MALGRVVETIGNRKYCRAEYLSLFFTMVELVTVGQSRLTGWEGRILGGQGSPLIHVNTYGRSITLNPLMYSLVRIVILEEYGILLLESGYWEYPSE